MSDGFPRATRLAFAMGYIREDRMAFFKSTPKAYSTKPAKPPHRNGREDGQADIVDVPQADGNSYTEPADKLKPADKPATGD